METVLRQKVDQHHIVHYTIEDSQVTVRFLNEPNHKVMEQILNSLTASFEQRVGLNPKTMSDKERKNI